MQYTQPVGEENWMDDPCVRLVIGWDRITGPVKMCWLYLWVLLGGRPGTVTITFGPFGRLLGGSERAARRWLDNLIDCGLLEVAERIHGSPRAIYRLRDPRAVVGVPQAIGRDDAQQRLQFADGDDRASWAPIRIFTEGENR